MEATRRRSPPRFCAQDQSLAPSALAPRSSIASILLAAQEAPEAAAIAAKLGARVGWRPDAEDDGVVVPVRLPAIRRHRSSVLTTLCATSTSNPSSLHDRQDMEVLDRLDRLPSIRINRPRPDAKPPHLVPHALASFRPSVAPTLPRSRRLRKRGAATASVVQPTGAASGTVPRAGPLAPGGPRVEEVVDGGQAGQVRGLRAARLADGFGRD